MTSYCATPVASPRTFWTTQPDACGDYESCGNRCGIPGLVFVKDNCAVTCSCACVPVDMDPSCLAHYGVKDGKSIATNDWARGYLLNIFGTNGRLSETKCGVPPGTQGGHWSDSYRNDGLTAGTTLRDMKPTGRVSDVVEQVKAKVSAEVGKLLTVGVALSVDVTAEYIGNSTIDIVITVIGPNIGKSVVNMSSVRIANEWVWRT